jgi:hypothetical protein
MRGRRLQRQLVRTGPKFRRNIAHRLLLLAVLLSLLFYPEDRGDTFLRDVGLLSKHSTLQLLVLVSYSDVVEMEAISHIETSINLHQTTWRHNPEVNNAVRIHCRVGASIINNSKLYFNWTSLASAN